MTRTRHKKSLDQARRNVLIVARPPVSRNALVLLLGSQRDLVVCGAAGTPATALRIATRSKPDLVIVHIPTKSGGRPNLIRKLKSVIPQARVLAIAKSADPSLANRALQSGADGFATELDSNEEILRAVRQVLAGELYVSIAIAKQTRP